MKRLLTALTICMLLLMGNITTTQGVSLPLLRSNEHICSNPECQRLFCHDCSMHLTPEHKCSRSPARFGECGRAVSCTPEDHDQPGFRVKEMCAECRVVKIGYAYLGDGMFLILQDGQFITTRGLDVPLTCCTERKHEG